MPRRSLLFAALLLLCAVPVSAATLAATSCQLAEVQAKIDAAVSGDTVTVPAGDCIWPGTLTIEGKNIAVIGAGMTDAGTNITSTQSNGRIVTIVSAYTSDATMRFSGFHLHQTVQVGSAGAVNLGGGATVRLVGGVVKGGVRLDHVRWTAATDAIAKASFVLGVTDWTNGVVDHTFIDYPAHITGSEIMDLSHPAAPGYPNRAMVGDAQMTRGTWSFSQPYVFGGGPAVNGDRDALYLEDNIWHHNGVVTDSLTGGGRLVVRHNTTWGHLGAHGMETGANLGARAVEYYNNKLDAVTKTAFSVHTVRGGGWVAFNERASNWANDPGYAVYMFRVGGNRSMLGTGDGVNFFDWNARGPITVNGQTFQPVRTPADARVGAVYAEGVGGATGGGNAWTLSGLECGTTTNRWLAFTLRNDTLSDDEALGGQNPQAPPNTWTMIQGSVAGSPCKLTIGGGQNTAAFTIGASHKWSIRRVTQFANVPGSGSIGNLLNGASLAASPYSPPPPAFMTGSPPQRWTNQEKAGVWQWANAQRAGFTGGFTTIKPMPTGTATAAQVPGGINNGQVMPGYPTQPATPANLRIGADWDPDAIQSNDPTPGAAAQQAWGAPYPHPLVSGTTLPPTGQPPSQVQGLQLTIQP